MENVSYLNLASAFSSEEKPYSEAIKEAFHEAAEIVGPTILIQAIKDFGQRESSSDTVKLRAPFPGIGQPWTQEKKDELAKVLKKYS